MSTWLINVKNLTLWVYFQVRGIETVMLYLRFTLYLTVLDFRLLMLFSIVGCFLLYSASRQKGKKAVIFALCFHQPVCFVFLNPLHILCSKQVLSLYTLGPSMQSYALACNATAVLTTVCIEGLVSSLLSSFMHGAVWCRLQRCS